MPRGGGGRVGERLGGAAGGQSSLASGRCVRLGRTEQLTGVTLSMSGAWRLGLILTTASNQECMISAGPELFVLRVAWPLIVLAAEH